MKFFFLLLLPLLFSCAKPNYVSPTNLKDNTTPSQTACPFYFSEQRLCLSMKWITYPTEEKLGVFVMKFYAEGFPDRPVTPRLDPGVKLWMPSMGHGSSPVVITKLSDETYQASEIYFIMLGAWEIRYQLKSNNEVIEEQIQKITL